MTVKNIDHFSDLSQEMQDQLLQYIEEHFSIKTDIIMMDYPPQVA